jgi:LemA protein
MTSLVWFLIIIGLLLILWIVGMFNGLIVLKNRVAEANSDIDVQLKRRHDLIPNLINTVKGYAAHESSLFEKVTEARSSAVSAGSKGIAARAEAENALTSSLRSLFAVAENYPDLKANTTFLALQEELSDTENKIMSSRRFYNSNVKSFNTRQEIFPTSIIARMFAFKKSELFELEDISERQVPQVDFGVQK